MKNPNIPKHPCTNKCTEFKNEPCNHCLIPSNSMELDPTESDFLVGDVVVLSPYAGDFAKSNNALYELVAFENKLKTLAILSIKNGVEVRSGIEHLRHATVDELHAKRRLNEAEHALAEVS